MRNRRIGAAAVIVNDEGGVPLVKQTYGRLNWELPGGAGEAGESPDETVLREVREETGLDVAVSAQPRLRRAGRVSGREIPVPCRRGPSERTVEHERDPCAFDSRSGTTFGLDPLSGSVGGARLNARRAPRVASTLVGSRHLGWGECSLFVLDERLHLSKQLGCWCEPVFLRVLSSVAQDFFLIGASDDMLAVAGGVDLVAIDDLAHVDTSLRAVSTSGRWGNSARAALRCQGRNPSRRGLQGDGRAHDGVVGIRSVRKFIPCSRRLVVVAQQPAQPVATTNSGATERTGHRRNQIVAEALMVPLLMVVRHEFLEHVQ
jgi:NUDIX domain